MFGGELAASGERIAIGAPSDSISTASDAVSTALDSGPTIDISGDVSTAVSKTSKYTLPQPDFQFDPTEVSKFPIDTSINLDALSPTGVVTTPSGSAITFDSVTGLWSDKTGVTFTQAQVDLGASKGVLAIKPGIDTSVVTPAASVKDSIQMSQNFAKYGSPDPTLGQKIRSGFDRAGERLKEAFTPENVVDKTLEVGENLLVSAAQGALAQKMQGDPDYVGDPAYAQQEYANQLQQFQIAYQNAGININDAYANMTYGSGDINAMGNELFRQDTIRIV